jgi:pimeloyl-ACP methyl ester carboxylesterase
LVWPLPEFGLAERIHLVRCPVTLIWGSEDKVVPPSYAKRFGDLLSDYRGVSIVDGGGHLTEWDHPDVVAGVVKDAVA